MSTSEQKRLHLKQYGAKIGYRKCDKKISQNCLGTAKEAMFRWRTCLVCRKAQLRKWYDKRVEARGGLQKRGRKPFTASQKKARDAAKKKPRKNSSMSGKANKKKSNK